MSESAAPPRPPDEWADNPDAQPKPRGKRGREPEPPPPPEEDQTEGKIIGMSTVEEPDPVEVDQFIAARVMAEVEAEQILTPRVRRRAIDLVAKPLGLLAFHVIESGDEAGPGVYGLMEMVDLTTGEQMIVTTGARHLLAQLYALRRQDALPLEVTIEHSQMDLDPSGFRIWLRAAPPPAE